RCLHVPRLSPPAGGARGSNVDRPWICLATLPISSTHAHANLTFPSGATPSALPTTIRLAIVSSSDRWSEGNEWLHEVKYAGHNCRSRRRSRRGEADQPKRALSDAAIPNVPRPAVQQVRNRAQW